MRKQLPLVALLSVSLATVAHAEDWRPDPGFRSLFNGRDLTGWCFRARVDRNSPGVGEITERFVGKAETSDAGRYSARDGILTVNFPKGRERLISRLDTVEEFPGDFTLKLEFRASVNADSGIFLRRPQLQCRDYLVAGPYKNLKQYRPQDWNQIEVVVQGGVARCTCNGEVLEAGLKLPETGPIGLEGDRGQMEYRRIQIKVGPRPAVADPGPRGQAVPSDWVDPATGHRVIRLSGDEGGSSLYFHQNAYTPKGDRFVFNTRAGIAAVDLSGLGKRPVAPEVVVPGARAIATAWRTPDVYYHKAGVLYATDLETGATRRLAATRGSVVNADQTLVIGIESDPDAAAKVKEQGRPMLITADLVRRDEPPGRLRPGGRSLALVVTDIKTGAARKIHYSTEWLNHLQASPADPHRLLFCHEGAWHQVDRVWTIRTDGTDLKLLHRRTMPYEIAGHEFFGHDGKWVWYDLQTPRSKEFWLAGVNLETGERVRYPVAREQWSVHYNVSRDGTLFAGDGGGPGSVANRTPLPDARPLDPPGNGRWIYLFTPTETPAETITVGGGPVKIGKLAVRRLVDLSRHNYALEPNVTITPDNRWVVFRSNMHGATHVYAVEVAGGR